MNHAFDSNGEQLHDAPVPADLQLEYFKRTFQDFQPMNVNPSFAPLMHQNLSSNGYSNPRHPVASNHHHAIARSKSNVAYPTSMVPGVMASGFNEQAFGRQRRAFSQQQAPAALSMSRSQSNRSDSGSHYRRSIPATPVSASPTTSHFPLSYDEGLAHRLPSVEEDTVAPRVGVDPSVYLANFGADLGSSYLASTGTNFYPHEFYSTKNSNCPSMVSAGDSLNDGATPLTRQNSSFDSPIGMNMARLHSSQSHFTEDFPNQEGWYPTNAPGYFDGKPMIPDESLLGLGANLPEAQQAPTGNMYLSSPLSVSMDRSDSNTSDSSIKSSASNAEQRAKDAFARHIQNSRAAIAPKPSETLNSNGTVSGHAGLDKKGKLQMKTNYQRPRHPKVHCDQCNEHPEGFRGDHELRRHISAKHEGIVKKFVCRDPATVGLVSNVKTLHSLSKCKACISGKQYGAYYNAAAHLRRTHFRPKLTRGKNKSNSDEKRGGKGGGDWPSMDDLKLWFTQIQVDVGPTPLSDQADEGDMGEMEPSMDVYTGMGGGIQGYEIEHNGDLSLDGTMDPTGALSANGIPMAPISSASNPFDFSSFPEDPQMQSMPGYAFSEHGAPTYASTVSSNTITPSTYHDMNQLNVCEGAWDSTAQ